MSVRLFKWTGLSDYSNGQVSTCPYNEIMKQRKGNRLIGFDYATTALYFVTSCVHDRICCFGEIVNHEMICNDDGKIAEMQWEWLQQQYPYIKSHGFVVMPNHIHAVLEINPDLMGIVGTGRDLSVDDNEYVESNDSIGSNIRTGRDLSVDDNEYVKSNDSIGSYIRTGRDLSLPVKIKSLSELMGAYKTTSSKKIHLAGNHVFQWQRSFHDHIVRNEESYNHITDYIATNPEHWEEDTFH